MARLMLGEANKPAGGERMRRTGLDSESDGLRYRLGAIRNILGTNISREDA